MINMERMPIPIALLPHKQIVIGFYASAKEVNLDVLLL
jgi:hypothetical protein